MSKSFYVYTHARPDGSVFYVGKGSGRRAHDFAPRRRRRHHLNVITKYGRDNIVVRIYPCASEQDAFCQESALIADLRAVGVVLLNLTDGGEGASGRKPNAKSLEAFRKCYGPGRILSERGRQVLRETLCRTSAAWRETPEGKAHVASLGQMSAAAMAARPYLEISCQRCGAPHLVKKPTTRFCARCSKNGARDERVRARIGEVPS